MSIFRRKNTSIEYPFAALNIEPSTSTYQINITYNMTPHMAEKLKALLCMTAIYLPIDSHKVA